MKLISWNVAGRRRELRDQIAAVARQEADLVALQEVRPSTREAWRSGLVDAGLPHLADTAALRADRQLFNLAGSRWPLRELPPLGAPFPERVLSVVVEAPFGDLELHVLHVPTERSHGLAKIETCEAVYHALARPSERHRILCGDFNTPRYETPEGEVITFAADHPEQLERWDAAERGLLTGLAESGLRDVFRDLNGYERQEVSWVFHTAARRKVGHRLDHILASPSLQPVSCEYLHGWREADLSDHSAIEAVFAPQQG